MQTTSSVLALIPARAGSKGIPHKNIRLLGGRPLLHYSCACALASRRVTRTLVSTDCPRIADIARKAGVEVPFLRPAELARDGSPTSDVIRHLLSWLRDHETWEPDIVVLLQPTAPLRGSVDVDRAVAQLVADDADSVVSTCAVSPHFHPEWQFRIQDGWLRPFSGGEPRSVPTRRQLLQPTYVRNGAIYAFWTRTFHASGSMYGDHCRAFEMPAQRSINIDSLEDWHLAESYLAQTNRGVAA